MKIRHGYVRFPACGGLFESFARPIFSIALEHLKVAHLTRKNIIMNLIVSDIAFKDFFQVIWKVASEKSEKQ